jgi:signal peptidase II
MFPEDFFMTTSWLKGHPRWAWFTAVAVLLLVDQITKAYFADFLALGESVRVTDWLNFVHVLNTGAAFSLLADAGGWQRYFFILIALIVVIAVSFVCLTRRAEVMDRWVGAFVVAGAGGNLIDRIQTGAVVDFLDFHWHQIHWPAFNFADVYVVCSVLTWSALAMRAPQRKTDPSSAEGGSS